MNREQRPSFDKPKSYKSREIFKKLFTNGRKVRVRPLTENNGEVHMGLLEICHETDKGKRFLNSREVDELLNPLCYGNPEYNSELRKLLYELSPIQTTGLVTYSLYGKSFPNVIDYYENLHSFRKLHHKLYIPPSIQQEILNNNCIDSLSHYLLYLPPSSFNITQSEYGEIKIEVIDGSKVTTIRTLGRSGWYGLDSITGLPCDDGKPHTGYNGCDRFLWILENDELRRLRCTGFFGSPIHTAYSSKFYGQDIIALFGPSCTFMVWEKY